VNLHRVFLRFPHIITPVRFIIKSSKATIWEGIVILNIRWKPFLFCLAVPLLVGGAAAFLSGDISKVYSSLAKPPLAPPGWIFPVVWSTLYLLMGYASYRVLTSGQDAAPIAGALKLYGIQLFFNFFWPIWFFRFNFYFFSFLWLAALWIMILALILLFRKLDKVASLCIVPYLLWVTYAGYLNFGIALLN